MKRLSKVLHDFHNGGHVIEKRLDLLVFLFASSFLLLSQPSFIHAGSLGLSDQQLEQLIYLTEEEIDLGDAALFLASEVYPGLDTAQYSKKLDRMVKEIQLLAGGNTDPEHRIGVLTTYLYRIHGFHFDEEDKFAKKLENRYLNGLLDTKAGSCTTMPLLYLVLAQRLGYPIYPVAAPQHLFCRYILPDSKYINIEATTGRVYIADEGYIHDMEIPKAGIKSGAYMKLL